MTIKMPPKLYLDANILFSAAYGSPAMKRLWEQAMKGTYTLRASRYVIEEARRNLDNDEQVMALEESLLRVQIVPEVDPDIPCPIDLPKKDRPVYMAALLAKADYLITSDLDHFGPYLGQKVQGVTICRLRDL